MIELAREPAADAAGVGEEARPPSDALVVAVVGRPHGVRGELRLMPTSGDPGRLAGLTEVWLGRPSRGRVRPSGFSHHAVQSFRVHGNGALVVLDRVDDREAAAALTHAEAWARAGELPAWGPDAFAVSDAVGAMLHDGDRVVGRVADVVSMAGRDYLEVEHEGRTVLVPAVREWLVELDLPGGRIVMRLPEGLLEAGG